MRIYGFPYRGFWSNEYNIHGALLSTSVILSMNFNSLGFTVVSFSLFAALYPKGSNCETNVACKSWVNEKAISCHAQPGRDVTFPAVEFQVDDIGYCWVNLKFFKENHLGESNDTENNFELKGRFWYDHETYSHERFIFRIFNVTRQRYVTAFFRFSIKDVLLGDTGIYEIYLHEGIRFNKDAVIFQRKYYLCTSYSSLPDPECHLQRHSGLEDHRLAMCQVQSRCLHGPSVKASIMPVVKQQVNCLIETTNISSPNGIIVSSLITSDCQNTTLMCVVNQSSSVWDVSTSSDQAIRSCFFDRTVTDEEEFEASSTEETTNEASKKETNSNTTVTVIITITLLTLFSAAVVIIVCRRKVKQRDYHRENDGCMKIRKNVNDISAEFPEDCYEVTYSEMYLD